MSVLIRVGFTPGIRYLSPCALLPHISTLTENLRRLFSVALSLESPPPVVSRHPCSLEPGLSSRKNQFARNRLTYSPMIITPILAFVKTKKSKLP